VSIIDDFWGLVTHDVGIDLGTANTLVWVKGKGIVANEPSVVAINEKTKQVLAVGKEARRMIGRTPASVVAIRPLKDGVISDFDTTEAMLRYFIDLVHQDSNKYIKIPRPRVVIGVPSAVTEVERRAVVDAAKVAGARQAFVIEETIAGAIGAGLPITEARGSMIVDIGGGTSDIAILSLGGIVVDKTVRIAGDEMTDDIVSYMKHKYNLLIGERSAEDVKIAVGSAYPQKDEPVVTLQGRDLVTGLPKAVDVSAVEIREAILNSISQITEAIKDAIEECPPELLADLAQDGVVLAGGGALIKGIDRYLKEEIKLPVKITKDPMMSVVRGTGMVLEEIDLLKKVQVQEEF
jgi:rod shape-determining protein MreB and related proteins